jgi:predicted RNase H-like nuclease (RuvC/YqgF family)
MARSENVSALAAELGIRRKFLYLWRKQLGAGGEASLNREPGRPKATSEQSAAARQRAADKARIAELERQLGRKQMEVDFLQRAFEHVREATEPSMRDGAKASINPFNKQTARGNRLKED